MTPTPGRRRFWNGLREEDQVVWTDPDGGLCSKVDVIRQIEDPPGRRGPLTVAWLEDTGQVYLQEIQ